MNKTLKKVLITGASLLMFASVGAPSLNANASRHYPSYRAEMRHSAEHIEEQQFWYKYEPNALVRRYPWVERRLRGNVRRINRNMHIVYNCNKRMHYLNIYLRHHHNRKGRRWAHHQMHIAYHLKWSTVNKSNHLARGGYLLAHRFGYQNKKAYRHPNRYDNEYSGENSIDRKYGNDAKNDASDLYEEDNDSLYYIKSIANHRSNSELGSPIYRRAFVRWAKIDRDGVSTDDAINDIIAVKQYKMHKNNHMFVTGMKDGLNGAAQYKYFGTSSYDLGLKEGYFIVEWGNMTQADIDYDNTKSDYRSEWDDNHPIRHFFNRIGL